MQRDYKDHIQRAFKFDQEIAEISCRLISLEATEIKHSKDDLTHLEMIPKFVDAYEAALKEIIRRREFMNTYFETFRLLRELFAEENKHRGDFLSKFGESLPYDFVPGLGANLPSLPPDSDFLEDQNLPPLPLPTPLLPLPAHFLPYPTFALAPPLELKEGVECNSLGLLPLSTSFILTQNTRILWNFFSKILKNFLNSTKVENTTEDSVVFDGCGSLREWAGNCTRDPIEISRVRDVTYKELQDEKEKRNICENELRQLRGKVEELVEARKELEKKLAEALVKAEISATLSSTLQDQVQDLQQKVSFKNNASISRCLKEGDITVFVRFGFDIWAPLIRHQQFIENGEIDLSEEPEDLFRIQDTTIRYVLDLESLSESTRISIQGDSISLIYAEVDEIVEEIVSLSNNRQLLSFYDYDRIYKVKVSRIRLGAGFEQGKLTFRSLESN